MSRQFNFLLEIERRSGFGGSLMQATSPSFAEPHVPKSLRQNVFIEDTSADEKSPCAAMADQSICFGAGGSGLQAVECSDGNLSTLNLNPKPYTLNPKP